MYIVRINDCWWTLRQFSIIMQYHMAAFPTLNASRNLCCQVKSVRESYWNKLVPPQFGYIENKHVQYGTELSVSLPTISYSTQKNKTKKTWKDNVSDHSKFLESLNIYLRYVLTNKNM